MDTNYRVSKLYDFHLPVEASVGCWILDMSRNWEEKLREYIRLRIQTLRMVNDLIVY